MWRDGWGWEEKEEGLGIKRDWSDIVGLFEGF